jgi:outer membrane immunogenic protein
VTLTGIYALHLTTHTATFGLAYKFGDPVARSGASAGVLAPPYKAPPAATALSWAGLYIGAGVGVRGVKDHASMVSALDGGSNVFNICNQFGPCVFGQPVNGTSFRASPYLGYNWQFGSQWVAGVEGDLGLANRKTTLSGMAYPFSLGFVNAGLFFFGDPNDSFAVKTTWDASARARIGYLVSPSVLTYATGGAAWLHVESTSTCNSIPNGGLGAACAPPPAGFTPAVISHSTTKPGWTAGGGIEAMLWPRWIVRAEYRYADFGHITDTDVRTLNRAQVDTYQLDIRTHTATFGLAYLFNWGRPVVAGY